MTTTVTVEDDGQSVLLECPWCGRHSSTSASRVCETALQVFLVTECRNADCRKGVLLELEDPRQLPDRPVVASTYPGPRSRAYDEIGVGVPREILRDYREAVTCADVSCYLAAALVGRRVLQIIARGLVGQRATLYEEINAIPDEVIGQKLKEAAHIVRSVGNDAAHAGDVQRRAVEQLLRFVRAVIHQVYVVPEEVRLITDGT